MEHAASHSESANELPLIPRCQALEEDRLPSYDRLEQTLGRPLTRMLVSALASRLLRRYDAT